MRLRCLLLAAALLVYGKADGFTDGHGDDIPFLSGLDLFSNTAAGFLIYVPPLQVLGGSIGLLGVLPGTEVCGHLFSHVPNRCFSGIGDVYVEADWSRFFGTVRPSSDPGAFPIAEGLFVEAGFGMVIPTGRYDATVARDLGLTAGTNTWDFAPLVSMTYTTAPILAEGTELSARMYWNNYLTNPDTNYRAGSLISIDFALTEHIGRLQVGLAGAFFTQIDDDTINGHAIPPDGRQATILSLGGVAAYDMPELGGSIKIKAMTGVISENFVNSHGIAVSFVKKLY
jgi:hypothetical protein